MEHVEPDRRHVVVIPPDGSTHAVQVVHSKAPVDYAYMLSRQGFEGPIVHLDIEVDGQPGGRIAFMACPAENSRARELLAELTGVHVVITGPAAFIGIPEKQMGLADRMLTG